MLMCYLKNYRHSTGEWFAVNKCPSTLQSTVLRHQNAIKSSFLISTTLLVERVEGGKPEPNPLEMHLASIIGKCIPLQFT